MPNLETQLDRTEIYINLVNISKKRRIQPKKKQVLFVNGMEMLCKNQQTCIKTDVTKYVQEADCKILDVKILLFPNVGR